MDQNASNIAIDLVLLEEKRRAIKKNDGAKEKYGRLLKKSIQFKSFSFDDSVFRRVFLNKKEWTIGKLGANWECLYQVKPTY